MIPTRSASAVGLLEVLGGEEDGHPELGVQPTHFVPDVGPAVRIETGGRLVEEEDLGAVDERGREVEPALHAARVGADPPIDRARRCRPGRGPRPPAGGPRLAPQAVETPLQTEQLAAGLAVVERRLLQRDADAQPDRLGIASRRRTRPRRARPALGRSSVHSTRISGRLPGAVRSEEPVDLPSAIARSIPSTACIGPKRRTRPSVTTARPERRLVVRRSFRRPRSYSNRILHTH